MASRVPDPRRRFPLPRVLAPFVTERTRAKGHSYFVTGTVSIMDASPDFVSAHVRGTRLYQVTLTREDAGYTGACECPFFIDRQDICKHIWAVVLAADAEGLIPADGEDAWLDVSQSLEGVGRTAVGVGEPRRMPDPWERFLDGVLQQAASGEAARPLPRYTNGELLYVIDRAMTLQGHGVAVQVQWRQRKKNGEWGRPQPAAFEPSEIEQLPDAADREILATLVGASDPYATASFVNPVYARASFRLQGPITDRALWLLASSRRLFLRDTDGPVDELRPVAADEGPPWVFKLDLHDTGDGRRELSGVLTRGEERMAVSEPQLVLASGHMIARGALSRLEHGGAFSWLAELRRVHRQPTFPRDATPRLVETLARSRVDPVVLPEDLRYEVLETTPRPRVRVERAKAQPRFADEHELTAIVEFDYDGTIVPRDARTAPYDPERRRMIKRNAAAEMDALQRLQQLGFRRPWPGAAHGQAEFSVAVSQFGRAVRVLVAEGWHVEAEGAAFRTAQNMRVQVRSGIDWFELHGDIDFGDGKMVPLTAMLAALRRGEGTILLGDGTRGMVPEDWLRRYVRIAGFGDVHDDHVRYKPSQTALLDALLEAQPSVDVDEAFARARAAMTSFRGVGEVEIPATFRGTLRDYQRDALAWFDFLRQFGFGGCLADDMGLGKTVMVLALLESRRLQQDGPRRPSVAVVPRSLVFNWIAEAKRFAPELRVLDYTGPQRADSSIADHDLVLTTYGTLRRDAARLSEEEFDYVILDEAQAIKNAATASSKAVRLLRGRHRLALSGTPVENHIGELWSLFEFLNPGLLGTSSAFRKASVIQGRDGGEDLALVSRALKPLILRRTKTQVAPELPSRTEQTIYCELDEPQRHAYDQLRAFYRTSLLKRVEQDGLAKSKIHVLEALLRLRQAASHIGLVDKRKTDAPSAKFDVLVPHLLELIDEGHKALVFSQFTELLGLLRLRLDEAGVNYEYLDGKTRDRGERVEHFTNDPACRVFLISLKAGGLGLNLTAAEYVFLLDPWWNPAAEAQAIDRAHRIGQARHVFAYRLIARDTVEEKVAELQASKRELADAILSADPALIRNLRTEDLELLLS
ncbi:MAG TPA: DEAD/DEAH box helicase [Vicinamibacterales bacterium]|nr:DEAD/DEAH box helicase [Vicinamibacterales bacterium]